MKTVSPALQAHFGQDCTTLAVLWRVTRTDGVTMGFTTHDQDLLFDGVMHWAATGYTTSAADTKSDLSVDNLEVTGFLDSSAIDENDIRAGLYDNAAVVQSVVNWADLSMGEMIVRKGWVGGISMKNGVFQAEIRGLTQKLSTNLGSTYGPICRAEFGSQADTSRPLSVRILPTGWYDSEYATSSPGAFAVHPDIDGHSVWCFQYFTKQAKRIDLDSMTVTANWTFPYGGTYDNFPTTEDGTAFFCQDSHGNAYTLDAYPYTNPCHLKKFSVPAMSEIGSLQVPTAMAYTPEDYRVYQVAGRDYLATITNRAPAPWCIFNLTDMSLVGSGTWTGRGTRETGWACFVDQNNDVWFVTSTALNYLSGPVAYNFYKSVQNSTPTFQFQVPGDGFTYQHGFAFCTYVPSIHAAFLGNSIDYTGDIALIDLATGAIVTKQLDDLKRFYNGTLDVTLSCMRQGVQNGLLCIPGDDPDPNGDQERGGWANLLDPATLAITEQYDLTSVVLQNTVSCLRTSPGLSYKGNYTSGTTYYPNDAVLGSNGIGFICQSTTSVDPLTEWTPAEASYGYDHWVHWTPVVPAPQRDGADNTHKKRPPNSSLIYFGARRQFVFAYEYVGSPVFLLTLPITANVLPGDYRGTRWLCGVDVSNYRQNGTVQSVTDARHLTPAAGLVMQGSTTPTAPAGAGWFNDGVITFTGGRNAGWSREIKSWDGTALTLFLPMPYPPEPGDTFTIEPGCDHTDYTCTAKFNNILNFRGENRIPGMDVLLSYPDSHAS